MRQRFGSLNTMEAELAALSEGIKVALWLRGIHQDIGYEKLPVRIYCDNSAAVEELKRPFVMGGAKRHHRVRLAWSQSIVREGLVWPVWIRGRNNVADIGTKPITDVKLYQKLIAQLMGEAPCHGLEPWADDDLEEWERRERLPLEKA
jgi:hypothetical protein